VTGLGIIAGGGELPIAIAQSASEAGRPVFVAAFRGIADDAISQFPHEWVSLGETGRTLACLRQHGCGEVLLAGKVSRPKWSEIRFDAKTMMRLPKIMAAAGRGDDALLRYFVELIESEGFRVVGAKDAAPGLIATSGVYGRTQPSDRDQADIALAAGVVRAMGAFDVGQAAAVCEGLVLAVEAAEGTDAMIARVGTLPETLRGTPDKRRGVLVKARKPTQDGRTDLPVIGRQTLANVAAVGLAGIAIEAGSALVLNKKAMVEAADRLGLFLYGFPPLSDV
jgi:hypothetical protein